MKKKEIFISYSHRDNTWKDKLITYLKVLELECHYTLWDDSKIEIGHDWLIEIEDALNRACVAVMLISAEFLISNFIRRKEIPILLERRKHEGLTIFPIIVRPCPWKSVKWLSSIQVAPNGGEPLIKGSEYEIENKLSHVANMIGQLVNRNRTEHNTLFPEQINNIINTKNKFDNQYPYFQARPKDLSSSFNSYITEKTKNFIGRHFVFHTLDAFLNDQNQKNGYFIIKGEPGIGKSALIAYLIKTRGYIHHFNIGLQNINKPRQFLNSVCAQLISRFELNHSNWPPDADKNGAFLNQLLNEASSKIRNDNKLVIAIDAIDEVDITDLPLRTNVLFLPPSLPSNVYIVVTMRPKHDIRLDVSNSKILELAAESEDNFLDAQRYIEFQISDRQIQQQILTWNVTPEEFIKTILKKSEGNFMYLFHLLPAIKAGRFAEGKIDKLPDGLFNYYRNHWRQMKIEDEEKFNELYLPVICVLAAVKEAVSIEQIADYTEILPIKINNVIKEWREFLYEIIHDHHLLYRLYHETFREFLSKEVDPGLKTYHAMISHYYLSLAEMES
ncbi:MAG: TIR domain-containing protein [bacterium]